MINFTNLLAETSTPPSTGSNGIFMWIMLAVVAVFFVVTQFFTAKRNKARQQEREDHLKTIAIGDYVLTIGMIYGKVVSINNDNSTIVLETGDDEHKGYVCVFMSAVHSFSKQEITIDPLGQVVGDEAGADVFEDMKSESDNVENAAIGEPDANLENVENGVSETNEEQVDPSQTDEVSDSSQTDEVQENTEIKE